MCSLSPAVPNAAGRREDFEDTLFYVLPKLRFWDPVAGYVK